MTAKHLERLAGLGRLVLDLRLAEMRQAARVRDDSRKRLAALAVPPAPGDLGMVAAAAAEAQYQVWADARRCELNPLLARQTAAWLDARDAARVAFGRAEVLRKLSGGT